MKTADNEPRHEEPPMTSRHEWSFFEGGGLDRLLRWVRLSGDAPAQVRRRVAVFVLVAWLPPLVLSGVGGQLIGGGLAVPFLLDVEAHVRFLVALPLLIIAEVEVHRRMPLLMSQFAERRLVPEHALPRFEAALASALRLRKSVSADIFVVALVYGLGILLVWRHYWTLDASTWYVTSSSAGQALTPAGIWYVVVSLPVVQFLLLRWYYRLFVWARFLWQVSRIELNLVPAHPDHAGGLGFLTIVAPAFAMLALAHGAIASGQIASRIFFAGARLPQFADALAIVVAFVLCIVLGPLLFFARQLLETKIAGLIEYGKLAERYVRGFDGKWLTSVAPTDEPLLGTADIQSLADLASSHEVVQRMRMSPVSLESVLQLVVATLVPAVPLLLTVFPLNELLKMLFGIAQ
jgi:hypothetical protein